MVNVVAQNLFVYGQRWSTNFAAHQPHQAYSAIPPSPSLFTLESLPTVPPPRRFTTKCHDKRCRRCFLLVDLTAVQYSMGRSLINGRQPNGRHASQSCVRLYIERGFLNGMHCSREKLISCGRERPALQERAELPGSATRNSHVVCGS